MGNAEGSWSGMRKYLEQKMLAPDMKGRVRYNCSTAVGYYDFRFFELYIDDVCFKRFSWETLCSWFVRMGIRQSSDILWGDVFRLMDEYPMEKRTEYTAGEFCHALEEYRNTDIRKSIHSDNPIVVMFALLDRRVGKRTLEMIREDMNDKPEWLQELYRIRTNNH